jgi:hypothetical protein
LDQDAITSKSNKKSSKAFAQALVQALLTPLLKNFMGSNSQYYDAHGIEMFKKLKNKILDDDDTIELFRQLLSPKMSPTKTPLDYKINIERVYATDVACQSTTASSSRQRPMVLTAFDTSLF